MSRLHEKTIGLEEALAALTPKALTMILKSVDGDNPILVGQWTLLMGKKVCGCLMMDGLADKRSVRSKLQLLVDEYGLAPRVGARSLIGDAADAFDCWAQHREYRFTYPHKIQAVKILSPRGRREVRAIIVRAQARMEREAQG